MIEKLKKLPVVSNIWSRIRGSKIKSKHQEVAEFWKPIISNYYSGNFEKFESIPKKELGTERIIWQYWGQGVDSGELPEVVDLCFQSVDQYKGDFKVIRIDDSNYSDYVDLPDYVIEKLEQGIFKRTFFSDLLRLALLKNYGGVWLDATILLTGNLDENLIGQPYFMYQRDSNEPNKKSWEDSYAYYWGWDKDYKVRVLNSIIYSKADNPLISDMFQLINHYWKTQNEIIDYFFFQILYNELIEGHLKTEKCMLISDVYPHILQTKFNGVEGLMDYSEAINFTDTHKMSYFNTEGLNRLKKFLNK